MKGKVIVGIDEAGRAVSKRRASSNTDIIGIDEAGRGPLAGPLVVAAVSGIPAQMLYGIRDSKKLTQNSRERWYKLLRSHGVCRFASVSHTDIDRFGIVRVTRFAIARLLRNFPIKPQKVVLDGGIFAPKKYRQTTIIKGDEKIPLIAAASIVAKVVRDRKMTKLARSYPKYRFAIHKGYGTKAHIDIIRRHGLSKIHRKSFCKKFV